MAKAKAVNKKGAKMGAPTKYKSSMCNTVIELMSEGASKAEVCLELQCSFTSFLKWQAEHDDFMKAVKKGLHLSKGKWESMGRKAAFGELDGFNATAWIFNMKNRFSKVDDLGDKWSDKQEVEHSGSIDQLSDDEINTKLAGLINAASKNEP